MARRDSVGIRLLTRNGHDWADRYPAIVEAVTALRARSCLLDGEAVVCDANGLAVFERLRYQRGGRDVFLFAFDLLELDGADLRREPFETIVSKRLGSRYRSGRSPDWLKFKNTDAPAVKREAEEDWGRK
jgi:ATP-dependent DNA ligase